jgi:hypothetical protein
VVRRPPVPTLALLKPHLHLQLLASLPQPHHRRHRTRPLPAPTAGKVIIRSTGQHTVPLPAERSGPVGRVGRPAATASPSDRGASARGSTSGRTASNSGPGHMAQSASSPAAGHAAAAAACGALTTGQTGGGSLTPLAAGGGNGGGDGRYRGCSHGRPTALILRLTTAQTDQTAVTSRQQGQPCPGRVGPAALPRPRQPCPGRVGSASCLRRRWRRWRRRRPGPWGVAGGDEGFQAITPASSTSCMTSYSTRYLCVRRAFGLPPSV